MAKNPVFPLYYNDILGSCRTWTDEEFGAYMRLLIEQWDKGVLPKDYQRLTRIATSLNTNWCTLKSKFVESAGGLQNLNLEAIRTKILKHKEKQRENILKRYQTSTKQPTKTIPLEDEKEIENEKENELEVKEGGMGEEKFIVPQMCKVWYDNFRTYTADRQNDFEGMGKILQFITRQAKIKDIQNLETQDKILGTIGKIAAEVAKENFWVNKPIKSIANNIQEFYNKIKNPVNGKSGIKNADIRSGVQAELDKRIAERG